MNQELRILQEQLNRQRKLRELQRSLDAQEVTLAGKVEELSQRRSVAQREIDKLEHHTLAAFFADLSGRKGARLDQGRQEAYEISIKYETAVTELQMIRQDLESVSYELGTLEGCERKYQEALHTEQEKLRDSDPVKGPQIHELETKLVNIQCQKKELGEAIEAGEQARIKADVILDTIEQAESMSVMDLMGRDMGMIPDVVKYGQMEEAQGQIERLQAQLHRFQTELGEVQELLEQTRIAEDGFLMFADIFLDDIFAGVTVFKKITDAKSQVQEVRRKVIRALQKLKDLLHEANGKEQAVEAEIKSIVTAE